jgi:hypothetical protein
VTEDKRRHTCDPANSYAPDLLGTPNGVTQQDGYPCFIERQKGEVEKHPLLIWPELSPGDVVSFRVHRTGDCVGLVESKTSDGLIIWIRDDLNERRLLHIHDCQSVRLLRKGLP